VKSVGDPLSKEGKPATKGFFNDVGHKQPGEGEKTKWYLSPIGVVLLLFFVLGPLGLPLLYKSPKFSKTLKIILTIAVMIYTAYLVFASLEIAKELYRNMEKLQELLG
jgi:hypothetical protein